MVTLSAVFSDPLSICMNRLSVEHLEHERNERMLFKDLDAEWQSGDLVQVSGPNGSAKTTLLRILCGLIRATSGSVSWNGHDSRSYEFLSSLLYLGHQIGVKASMTPLENSAGQQRRSALARLYLSQAPLWILDEPFTAIDKQGVAELERLIEAHTDRGGIALITTHQSFAVSKLKTLDLEQYKVAGRSYA